MHGGENISAKKSKKEAYKRKIWLKTIGKTCLLVLLMVSCAEIMNFSRDLLPWQAALMVISAFLLLIGLSMLIVDW
ncbi:MAG: hypothetical protein DRO01_00365 [Thermoproteota archaeon]|nr:MAG: hypothetical protein DRO01_00365 [Candidatus Korarchaeota archaeon]